MKKQQLANQQKVKDPISSVSTGSNQTTGSTSSSSNVWGVNQSTVVGSSSGQTLASILASGKTIRPPITELHPLTRCDVGEIENRLFKPLTGGEQEYDDAVLFKNYDINDDKEADNFRRIPNHKSLLNYHGLTVVNQVRHLTFEFTEGNLMKVIEDVNHLSFEEKIKMVKTITRGVKHLHSLDCVHKALVPAFIYFSNKRGPRNIAVRIGGFRFCEKGMYHSSTTFDQRIRRIVPILKKDTQVDAREVDIHLLGRIIYFIFCGKEISDIEVAKGIDMTKIKGDVPEFRKYLLKNLLNHMFNAQARLSAISILNHALFFNEMKINNFMTDLNILTHRLDRPENPTKVHCFINNMQNKSLKEDILRRNYDTSSLESQINCFRNTIQHIDEKRTFFPANFKAEDYVYALMIEWPNLLSMAYDLGFKKRQNSWIKHYY